MSGVKDKGSVLLAVDPPAEQTQLPTRSETRVPLVSIVLPVLNEEENLATLIEEIITTLMSLDGYLLSTGSNSSDRFFGEDEVVYTAVSDGSKLWATTRAEVGTPY